MKAGINLLLWTALATREHLPLCARLQAAGYDGVELPIFEGDAAGYAALGRELDRLGLGRTAVTIVSPEASPISPDPAVRRAAVRRLTWAVEMAAAVGAEVLAGPFHSPLAVFSGAGPTADERRWGADVLREVAGVAAGHGITLAAESLNRFECYFLTTAAQARALVDLVDHPNFRAMYDTFHANIEEKSPAAAIGALGPALAHVHISESDRGVPGTGMVHWDETFRSLREAGYDGWLVVESFGRAMPELAAATRIWRDLFEDAEDLAGRGLRFIRERWAAAAEA